MRISYSCPVHLKFAMTVEQWSELVKMTAECIDWLDSHDSLYDCWFLVSYAATSCALVQVSSFSFLKQKFQLRMKLFSTILMSAGKTSTQKRSC